MLVCAAARRAQVGSSEAAQAAVGALALETARQQSISYCAEGVSQLLRLPPEACEAPWGRLAAGEAAAVTSAMRLDSLAKGIFSAERTAGPLQTESSQGHQKSYQE